jgi:hypothetical protein
MVVEVFLGQGHVLYRDGVPATHELVEAVDPKPAHESIAAGAALQEGSASKPTDG